MLILCQEFLKEALEMQKKQAEEEKQRAELGTEILEALDSDSEYVRASALLL